MRSVAAIGNSRVIPAKAGIQWLLTLASKSKTRSVAAIGDGCVIPGKRQSARPGIQTFGKRALVHEGGMQR